MHKWTVSGQNLESIDTDIIVHLRFESLLKPYCLQLKCRMLDLIKTFKQLIIRLRILKYYKVLKTFNQSTYKYYILQILTHSEDTTLCLQSEQALRTRSCVLRIFL